MTIEIKTEKDDVKITISHTQAELRLSFTNPVKSQILVAMDTLIKETVADLYSILMEEEQ